MGRVGGDARSAMTDRAAAGPAAAVGKYRDWLGRQRCSRPGRDRQRRRAAAQGQTDRRRRRPGPRRPARRRRPRQPPRAPARGHRGGYRRRLRHRRSGAGLVRHERRRRRDGDAAGRIERILFSKLVTWKGSVSYEPSTIGFFFFLCNERVYFILYQCLVIRTSLNITYTSSII